MDEEKITLQDEPGEGETVLRNHPSVIAGNMLVLMLFLGFFLFMSALKSDEPILEDDRVLGLIVIFVASLAFIFYRRWKLTTYTFGETEITVYRNTVFKHKTHIQYSRLASVNVRRSIVNHIFGTTTLLFNVNSSVNTMQAEASLTLMADEADRLRENISKRIFQKEMKLDEDIKHETLVEVSNFDVILHGLFGQPTSQALTGLAFLAYSLITVFWGDGSGVLVALIMFVFTTAMPWVRTILRYYNYRIYRVGDTITVESGLISNYRSSFKIKKVNAVRIREPLLARAMGKALLEAEVIGLADAEGLPLLCPLKGKKTVMKLAEELVPEFLFDYEHKGQPRKAFLPTMANRLFFAAVLFLIGVASYFLVGIIHFEPGNEIFRMVLLAADAIVGIAAPVFLIVHGLLAQSNREFAMDKETFMFVIGAYDRETDFIKYDKVQMTSVTSGIIQRRFGVSRCTVSLMSARGPKSIRSGVFAEEELESVPSEVMARIEDGRYDYRLYQ